MATLVAGWAVTRVDGVYWSEVRVLFLAPRSAINPNALMTSSDSLISTAGVVGKMVDPNVESVVSDSVTLTGEGTRRGFSVRLPNSGGQWATNFDQPALDVQAVGSTAVEVTSTMRSVLRWIRSALRDIQRHARVSRPNLISLGESPPTVPVYFQRGSRVRALAVTLLLGTGLTVVIAGGTGHVAARRRYSSTARARLEE
jgi:hypothetical protein